MQVEAKRYLDNAPWVNTLWADVFFGVVIVVNAVVLAVDVELWLNFEEDSGAWRFALYVVQALCTVVFVVELILRLRANGCRAHFRYRGNIFDALVVFISILDLWILTPLRFLQDGENARGPWKAASAFRVLQLLRLLRVVRLLRVSRELSLLVLGLVMSVRSVFWVFLLLFLFMYTGALFCMTTLGASDHPELQHSFGSVGDSLYTHFKLITLEAWPEINRQAMEVSWLWGFYFVAFIMIMNLALVNLVTGVIMEGVMSIAAQEGRWHGDMYGIEAARFLAFIRERVAELRLGRRSTKVATNEQALQIGGKDFGTLLDDALTQEVLWIYGITLKLEADLLFEVIDHSRQGSLSVDELAAGLLELRGSREEMHPVLVRRDLQRDSRTIQARLACCQETLCEQQSRHMDHLKGDLQKQLRYIQSELSAHLPAAKKANARAVRFSHGGDMPHVIQAATDQAKQLESSMRALATEVQKSKEEEAHLHAEIGKWSHRCTTAVQTEEVPEDNSRWLGFLSHPPAKEADEHRPRRRQQRNKSSPAIRGSHVRRPAASKKGLDLPASQTPSPKPVVTTHSQGTMPMSSTFGRGEVIAFDHRWQQHPAHQGTLHKGWHTVSSPLVQGHATHNPMQPFPQPTAVPHHPQHRWPHSGFHTPRLATSQHGARS
mmetsp:Transcript_26648/g.48847  ORF Transcript_26648/g.48847 Transcript_26648/m.48847 type:complete len:662 (+) Transcript_26648:59-2044(+)